MTEALREKIKNGEEYYGLYISIGNPASIELAALAGYDFVRLDLEHDLLSLAEVRELIRTATSVQLPVFVRVPSLDNVCALLDTGASGIIAPMINNREAAIKAINEVKYAPLGLRGMAGSQRCTKYGNIKLTDYRVSANEDILLCVQIETKEGVENIDDILSLEGIDMVSSGKNDLSQSYGLPGQNNHPVVLEAENKVLAGAIAHGKQPVLLVSSEKRKNELAAKGVRGFMLGRDTQLLRDAMKANLAAYRK